METMKTTKPYPAELRDRAVPMVREHANEHASEWATICSIAEKVGCNAETAEDSKSQWPGFRGKGQQ